MKESVGWLLFTFVATLLSFFLFDWTLTLTCFLSGLVMSIKSIVEENMEE